MNLLRNVSGRTMLDIQDYRPMTMIGLTCSSAYESVKNIVPSSLTSAKAYRICVRGLTLMSVGSEEHAPVNCVVLGTTMRAYGNWRHIFPYIISAYAKLVTRQESSPVSEIGNLSLCLRTLLNDVGFWDCRSMRHGE